MKRFLLLLLITILMPSLLLAFGCQQSSTTTTPTTTLPTTTPPTTTLPTNTLPTTTLPTTTPPTTTLPTTTPPTTTPPTTTPPTTTLPTTTPPTTTLPTTTPPTTITVGIKVGNLAPDFQLQNLEGNTVSLSDFRGNPVILNFWSTDWDECVGEFPFIQQIYDEWQDEGLVILAINQRESLAKVAEFMEDNGYSFTVLLDTDVVVTLLYKVTLTPRSFFIDKDGIVQGGLIGPFLSVADLENRLSKIMP